MRVSRWHLLGTTLGFVAITLLVVGAETNAWYVRERTDEFDPGHTMTEIERFGLMEVEYIEREEEGTRHTTVERDLYTFQENYGEDNAEFMVVGTQIVLLIWIAVLLIAVTAMVFLLVGTNAVIRRGRAARYILGGLTVGCMVVIAVAISHFAISFPDALAGHWAYEERYDTEGFGYSFWTTVAAAIVMVPNLVVVVHPLAWREE
jgi:hypothetical protein